MSVENSSIAQLYIAYFNRAPEPLGYDFWCDVLDNPVTLAEIASDFATQPEAVAMYPLLEARTTDSLGDFLTTVYQNLFDRDPDAAGLEFWTGVIQGGADLGTILLEIINGASDEDRAVLEAKAGIAEYWVEAARMAPGYELTDAAIAASREAIEAAGTDAEAGTAIADAYFAPAAQVALTTVENDVRPGVLLTNALKVADIAVTGDDPEDDSDTVLGLTGTDAGQFEIVGTELFLKAGGIVQFGADKMMDVVVTLDDTRAGHFRMDGAESGAGLTLRQADVIPEGEPAVLWEPDDEFLVNGFTGGAQLNPDVVAAGGNRFLVAWESARDQSNNPTQEDLKYRVLDSDGDDETDEAQAGSVTAGIQNIPKVDRLPDGSFVIVWQSRDTANIQTTQHDIRAVVLDDDFDEMTAEFSPQAVVANSQRRPDVAALDTGNILIAWDSDNAQADGFANGVRAAVYDPDGNEVLGEFVVNGLLPNDEFRQGNQQSPAVTGLADGSFVVAYESFFVGTDGSGTAVVAKIFDKDGDVIAEDFVVSEFTQFQQSDPEVTTLANGNFVVTWISDDNQQDDDDGYAIKARIFDADGDPVSDEILVNEVVQGDQLNPDVTPLADGGFAIVWDSADGEDDFSTTGIKMRLFDAEGLPTSDETLVNELVILFQQDPAVAQLDSGEIVVTWTSSSGGLGDNDNFAVHARVFFPEPNTVQRVVADLNPDADFTYDPADMVGIPVEPGDGIV